jgi:DNA-binding transcriptional LysR family regulator
MRLADRIGRRLGLRDLHVLLAVVERGSMARAARDLAVSQPVVSKTIADLEHTLGVRLLDRSRNGVTPTPYGRALLKRSTAAFDELRQGVKEIEFLTQPTAGEVHVGALAAMLAGLLPVAIAEMRLKNPHVAIRATPMLTNPQLYDHLHDRAVDFIIGRIVRRPLHKDLHAEILFEEPLFVVCGMQSDWAGRRKIAMADLMDEPWVLPQAGTEVSDLIADAFHASGLDTPDTAVVCSSIEMIWSLLATGQFLAVLPLSLLRFGVQRDAVKTLPIKLSVEPRPVGIVTLKNRTLSPAVELFMDYIRAVARPLAKRR